MKITILWSHLASYSVEFFKELANSNNCRIQLVYYSPRQDAPYDKFDISICEQLINLSKPSNIDLKSSIFNFSPDCILMCSWSFSNYMKIARWMRKKGVLVISTMDNQWYGTLKQRLAVLFSRWYLKPCIDTFLVAGDRQAYFARKLGYENVLYGLYAAAVDKFISDLPVCDRASNFLYVGRLITKKGLDNLIKAYQIYRDQCQEPWGLKIAGVGELKHFLDGVPGMEYLGFVQPDELPMVMHSARCLILPSLWEPWGVVIHEAAAAGLPIISTFQCGAVTSFVRDGVNGFIISQKVKALSDSMIRISSYSESDIENMRLASIKLALMWTPTKLAKYFVENVNAMKGG